MPKASPALPGPPRRERKFVYLSLGSNLGDRVRNIRGALDGLRRGGVQIRRLSSFYKTEPVDFRAQPWFVNCVAEARTRLSPLRLLRVIHTVERGLGRRRSLIPKGPRTIDIDILLYENVVVRSAALTVPHACLSERRFVLVPLREVAPRLRHPVTGRAVTEMLRRARDTGRVGRLDGRGGPA